ncbi:hypothetical protein, partial [Salmonella sp. s58408]|uniref:hypothetical protein n=1 Tax=Salmonella sp. s58408 TaxID=3159701 RepID=UPI0039815AE1
TPQGTQEETGLPAHSSHPTTSSGLPNGQLPILEVDGYVLPQSMAILRYVGRLGGLYPSDDLEAAKCDAVLDSATDFFINLRPAYIENDQAKKLEMFAELAA